MDQKESVSKRIKKRRLELGISAQKLGDMIGKNKTTIYRYENGDIENLPYTVIEPIAKALQTTPGYLMGWDEERNEIDPQWGDDEANREYLADKPDLLEIYNDLVKSDELTILFDKTKDLEPKDIESVLVFVQMLRKQRGMDD